MTDGRAPCFGDYDLDGDLDLFVSAWIDAPGGNRLFRNDGNDAMGVPRFTDVTELVGLTTDRLRGFTPKLVDMTGDRYPELLLTNDFGTSRYFENLGGEAFIDRTLEAGVTHDCNGMARAWGTWTATVTWTGSMTNIYFPPPSDSCGNTMYVHEKNNEGRVTFVERARDVGVINAGWGWGTELVDLDLDGDLDLLATGGWSSFPAVPARVYLNRSELGALAFDEVAGASGLAFVGQGRCLVTLDHDRDGDRDVVIVDGGGAMRMFRNDFDAPKAGVTLRLTTWVNPVPRAGGARDPRHGQGGLAGTGPGHRRRLDVPRVERDDGPARAGRGTRVRLDRAGVGGRTHQRPDRCRGRGRGRARRVASGGSRPLGRARFRGRHRVPGAVRGRGSAGGSDG